jgi:predicted DNA-binding ribbon-helix-helix protein
MCEIYVKADPILYESRSRSVRINGVVTSIRLENLFWDVLSEIAKRDGLTTNQLITKLYDEIVDYRGEVSNLASFLRVSCLRYNSLVLDKENPVGRASSNVTLLPPAKLDHRHSS